MRKLKNALGLSGIVGFAAIMALIAGCASDEFPDQNKAVSVVISKPGKPGPVQKVQNMNDPEEIISLARNLSAAGRHREAASIYLDASERFHSVGREFENDCKKAAIREYCLDGNFQAANDMLDELEKEQDIYGAAYETEDFKKLRAMINKTEQIMTQ